MRKISVTEDGVILPSVSDNLSLSIYVQSFLSFGMGILTLFKPSIIGIKQGTALQMAIPVLGIMIALLIEVFNMWRNSAIKKAAIEKGSKITVMTKYEYQSQQGSLKVAAKANKKLKI